jgi:hypothetical protein
MGGVSGCGLVIADINGLKGPNMWGKDLYQFYITNPTGSGPYRLIPNGIGVACAVGSASECTAARLTNPEQMP